MSILNATFGWLFVAIAAIFALGLAPRFAPIFYPTSPSLLRRLAAPVIFAALALACFLGVAMPALVVVVVLGVTQIVVSRWNGRRRRPTAR